MNKRLIMAGIVIVLIVTALFWNGFRNIKDEGILSLSGNVEITEVNVGFKASGRISRLLTEEGKHVAGGEVIAELDNAELESLVVQNRASVQNADAQYDKASKDFERFTSLSRDGAVSPQQMDAAKNAYEVAVAQQRLSRSSLRTAEIRLKDAAIHSPISGIVLRKNLEVGETVAAGVPVFTIGNMDDPWIKVYVQEDKLGLVKLGQNVKVSTDSYPGKVYEGAVTYISSEAEFTPKNVQTREERVKLVFAVKVSVKNVNNELKPGMPADIKISLR